jgi:hypothetical protein
MSYTLEVTNIDGINDFILANVTRFRKPLFMLANKIKICLFCDCWSWKTTEQTGF